MANSSSQNYAPEIVGAVLEVSAHVLGRSVMDSLRGHFSTRSQKQLGDSFLDESRKLLQKHLDLLEFNTQNTIRRHYDQVRELKQKVENSDGSRWHQLHQARKYERLSQKTFKIIKVASDNAIDDSLMDQIEKATRRPGVGLGNDVPTDSTAPTKSNPFTDSHQISKLTDIPVNDLDEVEMTTYESKATGEGAVILDLHSRNGPTQHIVSTFPTVVFSDDTADEEASRSVAPEAAALTVHREDGTSPLIVSTPLPYLSPSNRTDKDAETWTISSFAPTELFHDGPSGQ